MTDHPAPTFIFAGTPKSGSTWLFRVLDAHPEVFVSPEKSTSYFETSSDRPISAYLGKFAASRGEIAIGEIAHDTYVHDEAAARIHRHFPKMKILFCLREPRDFCRSAIQWLLAHTDIHGASAAEIAKGAHLARLMDYPGRLQPFYDLFPREQIKVMFYDDLQSDPQQFLRDVFDFLSVDTTFAPDAMNDIINPSQRARFQVLTHAAFRLGVILRKLRLGAFVEYAKSAPVIERILYTAPADSELHEIIELSKMAAAANRFDLDRLETLIGAELPANWRSR